MQLWHPALNNGIILANFNLLGTIPVLNGQLYNISSGLHKLLRKAFDNFTGILYGPVDLEVFRLFGLFISISSLLTGDKKNYLDTRHLYIQEATYQQHQQSYHICSY